MPLNTAAPFCRSRFWLAILILLVIAIGLVSRRGYVPFPAVLGNYPGDALWAWVVLLCVAWVRPAITRTWLASSSLLIAFAIEFLQLYQTPWMQALRANKLAYLVLGNGFDPLDLVAYAAGIALGLAVDLGWERVRLGRG